jgi:exopolysaccharide biosynthesis protein
VTAALNLDGGGSATLAARDPEGAFHVINNPMDGHNVPTPGGSGSCTRRSSSPSG